MNIWPPQDEEELVPQPAPDMFSGLDPRVAEHMRKRQAAEQGVDNSQMIGVGVHALDQVTNSNRQPVALNNRMQDLGKAPSMVEQQQQRTDTTGLREAAAKKLDAARGDEGNAVKQAFEQRKAQLASEAAANQAAKEEAWKQKEFNYRKQSDSDKKNLEIQKMAQAKELAQIAAGVKQAAFDNKTPKQAGTDAVDRDYAKEYNDWTSTGKVSAAKNLKLLQDAKDQLDREKKDFFAPSGRFIGRMPDLIRGEGDIAIRQNVQQAAQGALKATLGTNFTEREGERIMAAAYDERLSPEQNMAKIQTAIDEIQANIINADKKASMFESTGSLRGLGQAGSAFPRQLTHADGRTATVSNEAELSEANTEGFN